MSQPIYFPIGFVSLRTGLSTHVLRAWERRYQAVTPKRSASGRRLYTQSDIDRLTLLKRIIQDGHSISQIARFEREKLENMAGSAARIEVANRANAKKIEGNQTMEADGIVDTCLQAVSLLDADALARMLQQAAVDFSRRSMLDDVVKPLAEKIGRRWSEGSLRIVHGHMASVVIHAQLISMLDRPASHTDDQPRALIATPSGQHCYLGALAVAVIVQDHGWRPVIVGYNLPVEEIATACSLLKPQLVALSITSRISDDFMHSNIERLSSLLDDDCLLIFGGRASHHYHQSIKAVGGRICLTTAEMVDMLG